MVLCINLVPSVPTFGYAQVESTDNIVGGLTGKWDRSFSDKVLENGQQDVEADTFVVVNCTTKEFLIENNLIKTVFNVHGHLIRLYDVDQG